MSILTAQFGVALTNLERYFEAARSQAMGTHDYTPLVDFLGGVQFPSIFGASMTFSNVSWKACDGHFA